MLKAIRQYIVPFLSLFLAIYFINFSIDAPKAEVKNAIGVSEVENIIALFFDLNLDINLGGSNPDDCQKEVEKEASADIFDFFHDGQGVALTHNFYSSLHSKYAHHLPIKGRALETISPPPKS